MRLSQASEYGLEGMIVLARRPGGAVLRLDEIASEGRLPAGFLTQIFQKLRRHQLVTSHRGAVRGYSLARSPDRISLMEIFEAIEGPEIFARCVFWSGHCNDSGPCRLHRWWVPLKPAFREMLERTTLEAVAAGSEMPLSLIGREAIRAAGGA